MAELTAVIAAALVSVGAVWALTEIGKSYGVPAPIAFVLVLAAIFGILKLVIRW